MNDRKLQVEMIKDTVWTFLKWVVFSCFIGFLVGAVGVVFHFGIAEATRLQTKYPWLLYFLPVGGIAIVLLYRFAGLENHKGTNLVIAAVHNNEKVTAKTAPLIFLSTIITHLLGGSSGREGAALQIGGSISSKIGRMMHLDEKGARMITMCGMSAAFAALFGTPLTAAIFSIEVISVGVMYYSALVPCMVSALLGMSVARYFQIAPEHFTVLGIPELSFFNGGRVLLLGILCAGVSILFCIILEKTAELYKEKIPNTIVRAVIGGLLVIALTCIVGGRDYNGAGIGVIERAFEGTARPEAFLLKMIFTAVTLGAGFKGGEIVPAFFTGATFGNVAGGLLGLSPSFGAGVGLLAVFCGVTNCPLTSMILSIELLGAEGLLFYALACGVSYMLSGYFGLYAEQKIIYSKVHLKYVNTNTGQFDYAKYKQK